MFKFSRSLMLGALLVVFATGLTSCKSKSPKPDDNGAAAINPDQQPTEPGQIKGKDIAFDPTGSDSGKIAGLETVHFDYDKASLSKEARRVLSGNSEWIKANPNVTVQIEGHTDERGSVEYNLALGERRAKSVKAYLSSLGVDGKRMTVISYGKEKPVATGDGEAVWSKNRRANFVPLSQ